MDRRTFLKTIGITTAGQFVPGLAGASVVSPARCCAALPLAAGSEHCEERTRIVVAGVGGAGGNAVDHLILGGLDSVEFAALDTAGKALAHKLAPVKLTLGATGLGAGASPELGRAAAEESRGQIRALLSNAHMAFIAAGLGGGTGTGASQVVAQVARELGILTVAVVTTPFCFEGPARRRNADLGIAELSRHVDSIIVVRNDSLLGVMGEDADVHDCFVAADDFLRNTVSGIARLVNCPGLVAVDFEDVRTAMGGMGFAMTGSAVVSGRGRAGIAARRAAVSPLLENASLAGARSVLVDICADRRQLTMAEVNEVMEVVKARVADDALVIYGTGRGPSLGDAIRVTLVATGLQRVSR